MAKDKDSKIVHHGVDHFSVSILDNGFTIEYSGYNKEDDWVSRKLVVPTNHDLHEVINYIIELSDADGND